jgi:WD40 repeat protein
MRFVVWLLVGAFLVSSCSTGGEDSPGRLAVVDDGQVVVMDPDGSNRIDVTDSPSSGPGRAFYFQPTWSPDGTLLAFSEISPATRLYIATPSEGTIASLDVDSLPFYMSWSDRNTLATLRNGASGLRLETTSPGSLGDGLKLVDEGAPLYFSWEPGGQRLATHIGTDRLELNDDGTVQPLGPIPGEFQAAPWSDAGIVAIAESGRDQQLSVVTPDGTTRPLARTLGPTYVVATSDGSSIAVQVMAGPPNGRSVLYQEIPVLPNNQLVIVDGDGNITEVTDSPVLAFFWSPAGDRLLLLDTVDPGIGRWQVWSEGTLEEVVRFGFDTSFVRDLLPFFDQYAQSVSLWSPDGTAFAFPGSIDGQAGIWVQELGEEPRRVSDGTWVAWSS